jgi:hypothetical protein
MEDQNHSELVTNISNGIESSFWGIVSVFFFKEVMPWAIHTGSAFLSGAVVMVGLFFLKRWLQKSKWLKRKFPKLYE